MGKKKQIQNRFLELASELEEEYQRIEEAPPFEPPEKLIVNRVGSVEEPVILKDQQETEYSFIVRHKNTEASRRRFKEIYDKAYYQARNDAKATLLKNLIDLRRRNKNNSHYNHDITLLIERFR